MNDFLKCSHVWRTTILAGAIAVAASGCAQRRGAAPQPVVSGTNSVMSEYHSPLARSELRERALDLLSEAGLSTYPLLRANAIEGLQPARARAEPLVRSGLNDENMGVRTVAAMTAGKLRLSESRAFIEPLLADESEMVRAAAIYALRRLGMGVSPTPLANFLHSPHANVRAHAAFILGELGDPSAVGMLTEAAGDDIPRAPLVDVKIMRLQIAEALVKLGKDEALETVRASLYPSRPEEYETAALAAQIIGQVGDQRSMSSLIYLTARVDEQQATMPAEVRLAAAASLAQLGNPRGSFIADEFWRHDQASLRAQSAFVFGETAVMANLPKLKEMLDDESGLVRVAAAAAILRITDRMAGDGAS